MSNVTSTYSSTMEDYNIGNIDNIDLSSSIDLSTITISNNPYSIDPYISTITGINGLDSSLNVRGDSHFEGDLYVKGKSITETLDKIEQRLGILHVNPELETRWKELQELGEKYRALEQEILEKEKVFNILSK